MDDLHTYRCRHDDAFNLYCAAEALKGITHAIYEMLAEVPTSEPEASAWQQNLSGLAWAGVLISRDVREFLDEATDYSHLHVRYADLSLQNE